jgi:hypothetical protein
LEFGNHGGRQLGEPLGGDYGRQPTLTAASAQIGECRDAEASRFRVSSGPGDVWREEVSLVDADKDGVIPVLARRADEAGEEGCRLDDALVGIEVGQVDVDRQPMMSASRGRGG